MPNRSRRAAKRRAVVCGVLALAAGAPAAAEVEATSLQVTGMTFVASRAGEREVVLRSERARYRPEEGMVELSEVNAEVTDPDDGRSFTMSCERAELDVDTQDFLAEGDVRGRTGEDQRYATTWVRYAHERGLLFSDAPVQMEDARGSFRGNGFRYYIDEHRFELLGDVRVEQRP